MNNGIRITYPRTKYLKLNEAMQKEIASSLDIFMNYAKENIQENFPYTLDISHDEYNYKNYLSVILYTSMLTGGANPSNAISSFVYDTFNNRLITMDLLAANNPNFLLSLSKESRNILKNNDKIVDKDMFLEGTMPSSSNFKTFAFTPTGFMIFFPQGAIAPYSSGSFKIVIPYSKL